MTRLKTFRTAIAVAALAAALTAPAADAAVDVHEMRDYIEDSMNGNAVGFGYAITKKGKLVKSGGGGWARRPGEGSVPFTSTKRIEVMSVTKNMTAVAVLRLLEQLDLSVDTPVEQWLPDEWVKGFGFWGQNGVTFRQLLTHTSGLDQAYAALSDDEKEQWGNAWDGLEFVVSNGAAPGSPHAYINANYALFRILIPALWRNLDPSVPEVTEANSWELYLAYMQDELFEPIGIDNVTCWPSNPATAPLAYSLTNPSAGGKLVQLIDTSLGSCGAYRGLHLSARDLVRFQVYLRYTKTLLSTQMRTQMDSQEMGWQNASNGGGATAGKYWHGGDGYWTNNGTKREIHTCVMKFPQKVEASLVVNSKLGGGKYQCTVLRDAFDAAT